MAKVYIFINLVVPLLASLLALQAILLLFRKELRVKINFIIFSVLAISTIRPNILGEAFGLISPLYFFILVYLSKSLLPEYEPTGGAISRARKSLFAMYFVLFLNWTLKATISSGNGYFYPLWPPIANLVTVCFSCYCLLQVFKLGSILRFFRTFLYLLLFQATFALISQFILKYQYCFDFTAGRGWTYSICAPGAVFSSQNRLTGIGGEPSIFAVYLAIGAVAFWWPQLKLGVFRASLFSGICIWAAMVSGATTGAIVGVLAASMIVFQRSTLKYGPVILFFCSLFIYTLIQTRFAQNYFEEIFSEKKKTNMGSISDRNLNLGLDEYLLRWEVKPFGSQWGIGGGTYTPGINLLAESLFFGPITIVLMLALVIAANLLSFNPIRTLSVGFMIFLVCLTLQPAWLNAIWFLLLYLFLIVDLTNNSSKSNAREWSVMKTSIGDQLPF